MAWEARSLASLCDSFDGQLNHFWSFIALDTSNSINDPRIDEFPCFNEAPSFPNLYFHFYTNTIYALLKRVKFNSYRDLRFYIW